MTDPDRQADAGETRPWQRWGAARRDCAPHRGNVLLQLAWVRANLKETPAGAEAYKKYLAKLDSQETEVDRLRDRIKKLQDDELAQRKAYEDFLATLDVE